MSVVKTPKSPAVRAPKLAKKVSMHVTLDSDLHERVKESAKRADRSTAAQIRVLLRLGVTLSE